MASSMAFFWADEPSAFRVPDPQSAEAEADPLELELELPEEPLPVSALLSEPQALSARDPTRATLASWPRRWIFTVFKPLHRGKPGAGGMPDDCEGREG